MRPVLAASFLVIAAGLAAPAYAAETQIPMMSLSGHGEVMTRPDTATVTSGVVTEGASAREALDANTAAMSKLIATLKAAGIADKDIQTSGFSVSPQYVYPKNDDGSQQPPHIAGYRVTNTVSVKIGQLDSLGRVLDKVVSVGANTIDGISFSVDDPASLYDRARREAFADARHKAQLYAAAAGVSLGQVISIRESTSAPPPPRPFLAKSMVAEAAPVPVEAGQIAYSVDVTVDWAIQPSGH